MKNELGAEAETEIHRLVAAAREGREPRVIARLYSGWALFGERQFLRGYALLLPDPVVPTLNSLGAQERAAYMADVSRLGDAILKVTGAVRINYAIFGNQEPALHTHVIPRYADEPEKYRTAHPWTYNWEAAPLFDRAAFTDLAEGLLKELSRMGVTKHMRFSPGANAGSAGAAAGSGAGVGGGASVAGPGAGVGARVNSDPAGGAGVGGSAGPTSAKKGPA